MLQSSASTFEALSMLLSFCWSMDGLEVLQGPASETACAELSLNRELILRGSMMGRFYESIKCISDSKVWIVVRSSIQLVPMFQEVGSGGKVVYVLLDCANGLAVRSVIKSSFSPSSSRQLMIYKVGNLGGLWRCLRALELAMEGPLEGLWSYVGWFGYNKYLRRRYISVEDHSSSIAIAYGFKTVPILLVCFKANDSTKNVCYYFNGNHIML